MKKTIVLISSYIAAQILSDIGSLRIVLFLGLSLDAGTFIYPITFTLRDLVHKAIGKRNAQLLIVLAALINLAMAGYFWWVARLTPDLSVGPQTEFLSVLSPVWRIVIASIVAEVLSELIDTEAYSLWVRRIGHKYQWGRVLFSNSISVPLDSITFCTLAFWGTMPNSVVISIILANILIKGAVTLSSLPLIYGVKGD